MIKKFHTILFVEDPQHSFSGQCGEIHERYVVFSVSDLHGALLYIREILPKLVVIDVACHGYTQLHELRQALHDIRIPIIALVAENSVDACLQAIHSGAQDVLVQPFLEVQLCQTIEQQLGNAADNEQFIQEQLHSLAMKIAYALPHEFRTPLNSLLGFIGLLRDPSATIDVGELPVIFESLDSSARRLYRIAEKFLLYAELERIATSSNAPADGFVTYSAGEVIHDVAMETAMGFGRTPDVDAPIQALSQPVHIKGQYLRFMIAELVSNACKFSQPGTPIQLTIREQDNTCLIIIQDRGRGMSMENVASITAFNQFERQQYEQQGLGFGLAIVKKIVHLYKGEFVVQSSPETGTTITMYLPLCAIVTDSESPDMTIQYITMSPL